MRLQTDRTEEKTHGEPMQSNISHLQEPIEAHQSLINVSTPLWCHIWFKLLFIETAIWRITRQNKQCFRIQTKLKEPLKSVFKMPQPCIGKDKRAESI